MPSGTFEDIYLLSMCDN